MFSLIIIKLFLLQINDTNLCSNIYLFMSNNTFIISNHHNYPDIFFIFQHFFHLPYEKYSFCKLKIYQSRYSLINNTISLAFKFIFI